MSNPFDCSAAAAVDLGGGDWLGRPTLQEHVGAYLAVTFTGATEVKEEAGKFGQQLTVRNFMACVISPEAEVLMDWKECNTSAAAIARPLARIHARGQAALLGVIVELPGTAGKSATVAINALSREQALALNEAGGVPDVPEWARKQVFAPALADSDAPPF